MREQLREHPALADPAGDQLGVLPSEVEDQYFLSHARRRRLVIRVATPVATAARPFEPMPTDCSRCSVLPSVCSAGATMTSARWKSRMSSYPQVAIEVRSAPIRLNVPSFS